MHAPRSNVYSDIHKGIRKRLFDASHLAGSTDWDDGDAVIALQQTLDRLLTLLRGHVQHEEEHMHPLIAKRAPGQVASLRADHEVQEAFLDEFEEFANAVFAMPAAEQMRPAAAQEMYRGLNRFIAMYVPHLDHEETTIMRTLWELSSDEEIADTYGRLIGSLPHAELLESVAVMLPALSLPERLGLMGGLTSGQPQLRAEAAAIARDVLSEADWTSLAARAGLA